MSLRRGVRSLALVPLLVVAMVLTVNAPAANASLDKATGGEFVLYVPLENLRKIGADMIVSQPIMPAYASFDLVNGPAVHFPVSGGTVESGTMLGTVESAGGLSIQKYRPGWTTIEKRLDSTQVKIVNGNMLIGNVLGLVPIPSAQLINPQFSKDPASGVIHYEADAQIDAVTALVLNTYFDTTVFEAGWILGRMKADIETKPLL
jgi:hypothetical protein